MYSIVSVQRCSLLERGQFVCEKSNWYYLVVTNSLHTLAITARGLPKGSYTRSFFSSGDSLNESEHLSHKPGVSQKHPTPSTEVRLITLTLSHCVAVRVVQLFNAIKSTAVPLLLAQRRRLWTD